MKAYCERLFKTIVLAVLGMGLASAAFAEEAGIDPWMIGMQKSVTDVMDDIRWFNSMTFWLMFVIVLFVLALLILVMVKFNAKANPTPSRTTHNTFIEVVWTVAPIFILLIIAIPSFRLLYKQLEIPQYDMTVKAIGYQWYWGYEYTDEAMNELYFDSYMVGDTMDAEADLAARTEVAEARGVSVNEVPRLLSVDNEMVIPVDTTVRLQVVAEDVLHAFAMPAFGVKIDAVPGRLNETWFRARETGVYYGQCSELCGLNHAFMPIAVRVVTKDQFTAWAEAAQSDLETANQQLLASIAAQKATVAGTLEEISVARN